MHIVSNVVSSYEIVKVTGRSTDTFTIVRAQEGTTAAAWAAGDTVALLPTAGGLAQFAQSATAQSQSYNYAQDTGAVNAYSVVLTPALTSHLLGTPIRFKASNTNTGSSTFNDGTGIGTLYTSNGLALLPSTIVAGGIYEVWWDGVYFRLGATPSGTALAKLSNLSDVASPGTALANIGGNNASNITTGTLAYARTGGSVSLATNGWEILPSGRIEQWGVAAQTGSSPIIVSFPRAFTTVVYNIIANPTTGGADFYVNPVNNNEFEIFTQATTVNFYWRAIGA
jgi:hypothetical protein